MGCAALLGFAGRAPSGPSLILAGVALSALAAAFLALALTLAPNPFALAEITFWLMGGLEDRSLAQLALAGPPILLGCAVLLTLGRGLDALALGEETAASLGAAGRAHPAPGRGGRGAGGRRRGGGRRRDRLRRPGGAASAAARLRPAARAGCCFPRC